MSKLSKIICVLLVLSLIFAGLKVYAATPGLEQITNTFNNSSTVQEYATNGSVMKATTNENKINITITANNTTTNLEYTLENLILSANFSEQEAFSGLIVTRILTDCIGQLHGYSDGELFPTLNSQEINSYTVGNEGFEIKETADKNYQIKIDVSKKIPLIDTSNTYIEIEDLQNLKEFISGDGSAEKSKGNVWFNKSGYDGKYTLLVAEKNNLTENAYKSILSIIEVMFNSSKTTDYFKTNYSEISIGNKEFTGFKIEINPNKTDFEEQLIPSSSGYKFVRITIDKNLANSAINESNKNKENNGLIDEQDDKQNSEKLPKTGLNINTFIFSIIIIAIILNGSIFYKKYKNIK